MKYLQYRDGDEIPILGLGTWKSQEGEAYEAVSRALEVGYRHVDCAWIYGNQSEIGDALKNAVSRGVVARDQLHITSKLWNSSHRRQDVRPALLKTLDELKLAYLDLYLMHWPVALRPGVLFPETAADFLTLDEIPLLETWVAMEDCVEEGLVRHIGMSNFNVSSLQELSADARIKPEMNQVETHPFLPQRDLIEYCSSSEILVTAYSPLGSMDRPARLKKEDDPVLLEHPVVAEVAKKCQATPAQVLIAWSIRRGVAVIPKSANQARIQENLDAVSLDLAPEDVERINDIRERFRYVNGQLWTSGGSPYSQADLWGT